jgi:hypothetical protein
MSDTSEVGFGGWVCILLFFAIVGGLCSNYILGVTTGIDIPWYGDAIIGVFATGIVIPGAVVCYTIKDGSDVRVPFWPYKHIETTK